MSRAEPDRDLAASIIIVTWNCSAAALDCLSSLRSNPPALPWEAIVVDNGSTDGTPEAVRTRAPWARLIANPTNRGLAAANNQGMLAARGRDLVLSNPDVLWRSGAIDAMLAMLEHHPRAAWIVPRLRYDDGTLQTSAGDMPDLWDALGGRQLTRARRRRTPGSPGGLWWDGWPHDEARTIGRGHEAAYLVRRRAVEEVGVQDERYRLDWEGVEWTARMRAAGWEVWLCPEAEVVHLGGASIRQVPYRWIVSSHRGMYRYFAARTPAAARPVLAAAVVLRATAKLATAAAGVAIYERAHRGRAE